MSTLIITGGRFDCDFVRTLYLTHSYDYVIAVDNGEKYAKLAGIPVDMLVGDFDTRGDEGLSEYVKAGIPIIRSIPEKDDTDTEMAVRECVRRGSDCDIVCATGGRIDHLLGNIHTLKIALDAGLTARMLDPLNTILLCNQSRKLSKEELPYKYLSLIPFAGSVTGINLRGMKYEVTDFSLVPGISRGISNEIVANEAKLELRDGILIIINSKDRA